MTNKLDLTLTLLFGAVALVLWGHLALDRFVHGWPRQPAVDVTMAVTFSGMAVVGWVLITVFRWRGGGETRCRNCRYILRGISEPRCPECGEKI